MDVLFGIETGNKNADILYWMDQYSDDMFANSIIIGDDLLNGFIVMICNGDDKGIYYWDDAYHFEESNDENNMYRIADSFSDFLGLLK